MTAASAADRLDAGFGSNYPVQVSFDPEQRINRLWGVPILGMAVRWIALVPHFIVAYVLLIALSLSVLVAWIPVLFLGRQPLTSFFGIVIRYITRIIGWAFFLAGPYPPILPGSAPYPINVDVPAGGSINRLWGIPFLGMWLRAILVIPHAIVLALLGIALWFGILVIWIPILLNGRMPQVGYQLYGGYLRVYARAYLWVFLTPYPYPPILP